MGLNTKINEEASGRGLFFCALRCSVFSEGRKNEMAKFVRFFVLEIFAKDLIK